MERVNTILKNFISLIFGRAVALVIGAILVPFLARALGVEDYGRFIAALAVATVFAAFLDLGLTRILLREGSAAKDRVSAHLGNILLVKGLLAGALLVVAHFYAAREGWLSPIYQLTLLLTLCKVADNFNQTFDAVFQIFQRMEYSAVILICGRILLLGAVLLGWNRGAGLLFFGWIYFLVSLATAVATVLISGGRFARPRWNAIGLRETIGSEGIYFALSSLMLLAGSRLDMVVLKESADAITLGHYAVVAQVLAVFQILPQVLQSAVLPELFHLARNRRDRLGAFFTGYLRRSLLLAQFPVLWALLFPERVTGVFGVEFLPAAPWIRMLAAVLFLRFLTLASGNLLTALERQKQRALITGAGVGLTLLLLLLLAPKLGIRACVIAIWSGEALLALAMTAAALRQGFRPARGEVLRVLASAALASIFLWGAKLWIPQTLILSLVATTLAVSLSALLFRVVSPREIGQVLMRRKESP